MTNKPVRALSHALLAAFALALLFTQSARSQELRAVTHSSPSQETSGQSDGVRTRAQQDGAQAIKTSDQSPTVDPCDAAAPPIFPALRQRPASADTRAEVRANISVASLHHDSDKFFTPPPASDGELPAGATAAAQQPSAARTPLTPGQKMRRAFRNAFFSPGGYARTALSATLTQWGEDSQPHKTTEDEVADGLSRFAIRFSTRATRTLLGSGVFPILFRQDPRYDRSQSKNFAARAAHAASRVFVTRSDSGRLQPNYSRFAGVLSASAISNLWERSTPGHDRIGTDATFRRFVNSFPNDALYNVLREFWPDIKKIFKR